jgi:hypothetical protein
MQHLYEDSTVALARAVEQLSAALTAERAALEAQLKLVEPQEEEELDASDPKKAQEAKIELLFSSLESATESVHSTPAPVRFPLWHCGRQSMPARSSGCVGECFWVRCVHVARTCNAICCVTLGTDSVHLDALQARIDFQADGQLEHRRLKLRNLVDSIDKRIDHLFARTEEDILGRVLSQSMQIAPRRAVQVQ